MGGENLFGDKAAKRQPGDSPTGGLPVAVLLALMIMPPLLAADIKCWTNSDGVRECGNRVPPEYAQGGYSEVSPQGIVVDEQERALTDEEIAERRRQAEQEAARQRELEDQRRQDRILLYTFSNEADLITARDDKLAAMDAQIRLAESRIDKLEAELEKKTERAASAERSGREPGEELLADIDSLKRQIRSNTGFIENIRAEQARVKAEYDADIERFRNLKGLNDRNTPDRGRPTSR